MIEMFIKPKRAERKPWELFWIGLLYSSIALLLVSFVFSGDSVLSQYSGILLVTFSMMIAMPFMYYIVKLEEGKDVEISESGRLLKEHSRALKAMMWLFLGFVVGFSFWYIVLPNNAPVTFNAQIEVFCAINSPNGYDSCLAEHGMAKITGHATSKMGYFMNIFANNMMVMIFTLLFSLAFGAGAIFILVWNASVIAVAVGVFAKSSLINLPKGLFRYLIHGLPEISAYFVAALAGGIISVAVIRKDLYGERMWRILQDALLLIILAVLILMVAGLMEAYLTPIFF
jgi:uncharacterized membrane protein SpoIIM required for sporulation